jgi:hypothetical protein
VNTLLLGVLKAGYDSGMIGEVVGLSLFINQMLCSYLGTEEREDKSVPLSGFFLKIWHTPV